MTSTRRRLASWTGLALLAVTLVGCAAPEAAPERIVEPQPTPSSTAESDTGPRSVFALDCDELVPRDRVTNLVGADPVPQPNSRVSPTITGVLSAALLHDGALVCEWGSPSGEGASLRIMVLADASEALRSIVDDIVAFPSSWTRVSSFDQGAAECYRFDPPDGLSCSWTVSRGDIWIHARAVGLPPSEAEESAATENADVAVGPRSPNVTSSALGSILDDAFTVLESTPRQTISRPALSGEQCDTIVRPALDDTWEGAEVFGGPITLSGDAVFRGFAAIGGAMGFASAERLGYLECVVVPPGDPGLAGSVQLVVARGASWMVEDPWAVDIGGATVDGDVTSGCAITGECWAFAVVGDDLLVAEAASYGDETLAVRLITAMTLTR